MVGNTCRDAGRQKEAVQLGSRSWERMIARSKAHGVGCCTKGKNHDAELILNVDSGSKSREQN